MRKETWHKLKKETHDSNYSFVFFLNKCKKSRKKEEKNPYQWVNSKTIYLMIICCSFLLLFALDYKDLNFVPVSLETQDKRFVNNQLNIVEIFINWKK